MLTTPFYTRLLPTSEYGITGTFQSWADIILNLITFGTANTILNLIIKYRDEKRILSSIEFLNILISSIWWIVTLIFAQPISEFTELSVEQVFLLLTYCTFQNVILCWVIVKQYQYSYKILVLESIIYSITTSAGGLLLVIHVTKTATAKLLPQALSVLLIGIMILIFAFRSYSPKIDSALWKYALGFSIPLIPNYLSMIVLQSSDKIMIQKMCGASDVAIYTVAYSVGSLINMVVNAVNSAFAPYQYQQLDKKDYKKLAKSSYIVMGFVAICLCLLMTFSYEIIYIFGGKKYLASVKLVAPICLGVYYAYAYQIFAQLQQFYEQKRYIAIPAIICALANIITNYIFIKIFGFSAAAYTTFACYLLLFISHYIFYKKTCKKIIGSEIYDMRIIFAISCIIILYAPLSIILSKLYIIKYSLLIAIALLLIKCRKKLQVKFRICYLGMVNNMYVIGSNGYDYPSERMINVGVENCKYKKIKENNHIYIKSLAAIGKIFNKFKRSKIYSDNIYFWINAKKNDDICVYHLFNKININKDCIWVSTFEKSLPGYFCKDELVDQRDVKSAVKYICKDNCLAILAMSNWAYRNEVNLIKNVCSESQYNVLLKKLKVLYPPQKLNVNYDEVKNKYSGIDSRALNFIFVGRELKRKGGLGLLRTLDALNGIVKYHAVIIGKIKKEPSNISLTTDEIKDIYSILDKNSNIEYFDELPNDKVISLMKKSDVGFLPTLGDTFGFSVLEMQSCGCPVVTTNREALSEINNNDLGWIIDTRNKFDFNDDYGNYNNSEISNLENYIEIELKTVIMNIDSNKSHIIDKALSCLKFIKTNNSPELYRRSLLEIYKKSK